MINVLMDIKYLLFWFFFIAAVLYFTAVIVPVLLYPEIMITWFASTLRSVPRYFHFAVSRMWQQTLTEMAITAKELVGTIESNVADSFNMPSHGAQQSSATPTRPEGSGAGSAGFLMMIIMWVAGRVGLGAGGGEVN